ncbi:hypothetical protein EG329_002761 [Mollisiaceae sp. DMI_Dod_QoI]|nr:hypothetical protein EG329_002761 [Helotiales sp. DMI_Dod_QoI]
MFPYNSINNMQGAGLYNNQEQQLQQKSDDSNGQYPQVPFVPQPIGQYGQYQQDQFLQQPNGQFGQYQQGQFLQQPNGQFGQYQQGQFLQQPNGQFGQYQQNVGFNHQYGQQLIAAAPANDACKNNNPHRCWFNTQIFARPNENDRKWTEIQSEHVDLRKVTSVAAYTTALHQWAIDDKKSTDFDKKFPRWERISNMIDCITTGEAPDMQFCIRQPSNLQKASWKHNVKTSYEYSFGGKLTNGLVQKATTLYNKWSPDDNKTLKKLVKFYHDGKVPYGERYQPSITPLEESYIELVAAHIDQNGKHRGRDSTFDIFNQGVSDSITKDLTARFIAECPTCRPQKFDVLGEAPPRPKRKRVQNGPFALPSKRAKVPARKVQQPAQQQPPVGYQHPFEHQRPFEYQQPLEHLLQPVKQHLQQLAEQEQLAEQQQLAEEQPPVERQQLFEHQQPVEQSGNQSQPEILSQAAENLPSAHMSDSDLQLDPSLNFLDGQFEMGIASQATEDNDSPAAQQAEEDLPSAHMSDSDFQIDPSLDLDGQFEMGIASQATEDNDSPAAQQAEEDLPSTHMSDSDLQLDPSLEFLDEQFGMEDASQATEDNDSPAGQLSEDDKQALIAAFQSKPGADDADFEKLLNTIFRESKSAA